MLTFDLVKEQQDNKSDEKAQIETC